MGYLSELFAIFRRDRPEVRLQFREGSCPDLTAAVRRGKIDLGIVAEPSSKKGYDVTDLWAEPFHVAMPATHSLAGLRVINWHDLHDARFLVTDLPTGDFAMTYLRERLTSHAVNARIERLAITRESLLQIVAHGDGVTLASSGFLRLRLPGVVFRPLGNETLRFGAVHPKDVIDRDLLHLISLARDLHCRGSTL